MRRVFGVCKYNNTVDTLYTDNIFSYSRQNLLSTKSNEYLQNQLSSGVRSNNSTDRTHGIPTIYHVTPIQKRNKEHQDIPIPSVEVFPRRTVFKSSTHPINTEMPTMHADDDFNVGVVQDNAHKADDSDEGLEIDMLNDQNDVLGAHINFQPFSNTFNEPSAGHSNVVQIKLGSVGRNRNEWHDDSGNEPNPGKCKLFDELRENVYREVASLISANQGRPHFLIQLFRDLQLISSDPLRKRALQSIQSLISQSIGGGDANRGTFKQVIWSDCQQFDYYDFLGFKCGRK